MTTIAAIKQAVSQRYGVSVRELVSQRRSKCVCQPRHVAMFLARELTPHSLAVIGRTFGDRDHTTVINACLRVEKRQTDEPGFASEVAALADQLQPESVDA